MILVYIYTYSKESKLNPKYAMLTSFFPVCHNTLKDNIIIDPHLENDIVLTFATSVTGQKLESNIGDSCAFKPLAFTMIIKIVARFTGVQCTDATILCYSLSKRSIAD